MCDTSIMDKINTEILQALYKSSGSIAALLDYLGGRERNYRETKPETLILRVRQYNDTEVSRSEMIKFFRELERAGCGRYVEGRWGHSSRFEWTVKMSVVGQVAKGISPDDLEDETDGWGFTEDDVEPPEDGNFITHEFFLRPDFQMSLTLPSDLRSSEAERISDWIKTLPFE